MRAMLLKRGSSPSLLPKYCCIILQRARVHVQASGRREHHEPGRGGISAGHADEEYERAGSADVIVSAANDDGIAQQQRQAASSSSQHHAHAGALLQSPILDANSSGSNGGSSVGTGRRRGGGAAKLAARFPGADASVLRGNDSANIGVGLSASTSAYNEPSSSSAQVRHSDIIPVSVLQCEKCNKMFKSKHALNRHSREKHYNLDDSVLFNCNHCKLSFASRTRFNDHQKTKRHLKRVSLDVFAQQVPHNHVSVNSLISNVLENSNSNCSFPPSESQESSASDIDVDALQNLVNNAESVNVYDDDAVLQNIRLNSDEFDDIGIEPILTDAKFGYEVCFKTEDFSNFSVESVFEYFNQQFLQLLENLLNIHSHIKLEVVTNVHYMKMEYKNVEAICSDEDFDNNETIELYPRTGFVNVYLGDNLQEEIDALSSILTANSENMKTEGSGYCIDSVQQIMFRIFPIDFYAGKYIATPEKLKMSQAIINVQNEDDDQCLKYSILAALNPRLTNKNRVASYKKVMETLNFEGIKNPPTLEDFTKIEKKNEIRLNAFIILNNEIVPLKLSKLENGPEIDLLLLYERTQSGMKYHWTAINSFNRLFFHKKVGKSNFKICKRCFTIFTTNESLKNHSQLCRKQPLQKVKMPKEGSKLSFVKGKQTLQIPQIIVYDFESLLETVDIPSPSGKTTKVKKHKPIAFSYCVINEKGLLLKEPFFYCGDDCVDVFFERLFMEEKEIMELRKRANNELIITPELLELKEKATHCYLCFKSFDQGSSKDPLTKCLDHDHLLPVGFNFRGVACSPCNIRYRISQSVTVIGHNVKKYDFKLIFGKIPLDKIKREKIPFKMIAKSSEELISFSIGNLEFKDSLQFAMDSLENLANLLQDSDFRILRSLYPDEKQFRACRKKQFFPYNYLDSVEKLDSPLLPPQSEFFNDLTQKNISDSDYMELKETIHTMGFDFENETFRTFLKFYSILDTVILCDVICNLRENIWENYKLEMLNFVSNPGLSEAACLKMTGIELELLNDPEQYLWFKSAMRGGICGVGGSRFSEANNSEMGEKYDKTKPTSWISFVDIVNLYGYTMTKFPMPYANFQWMSEDEIEDFQLSEYDEFGDVGYLLSTEWYIDPAQHDFLSTFCPFPTKMVITDEMLSPYSKEQLRKQNQKLGKPERLVCTLKNHTNYLLSATVAKFYATELNIKLVKINGGIRFSQKYWLAPYIEKNTSLRQSARSSFHSRNFKLLTNSIYGRFCMNQANWRDFMVLNNVQELKVVIGNPLFKNYSKIGENMLLVELIRPKVDQNRPIYVGFTILDVSKILLFRFVYKTLIGSLSNIGLSYRHLTVSYCDTDSLCFTVKNVKNIYEDLFSQFKDKLDTSDFPTTHFLFSSENHKVPGKFTIETGTRTVEFIAVLSAKAYSLKLFGNEIDEQKQLHIMKVKSVPRKIIKSQLKPDDFKRALLDSSFTSANASFHHFRSSNHQIYTCRAQRKCLNTNDIKTYVLADGITCLPYFHYRTM
jgi:DNA polymerase type B, organellar and viral